MWPWSKREAGTPDNSAASGKERRVAPRVQTAIVSCDLGPIQDVSRTGLRVRVARRPMVGPAQEVELELAAPADSMTVRGRVVRIAPIGGGRYDLGIEFIGLSEQDQIAVETLARHGKRKMPGAFSNDDQRDLLIAALKLPDFYEALGLQPTATCEEVQAAYRALARQYHPDVCREPGAQQRFCLINDAHSTLTDEVQRKQYDSLYALRRAA